MGKKEINKPEITVETFNRAIRTYQREDVSYLLAHGILKQVPEDEKLATYQQLVALQNMEILQAVAKEESHLNPQMFAKQSDSSQSKVFVNQCLMKFRKHFQYEDENVCDTLFTLACQCGCVGMLRFLMEQHKAEKRYAELGSYSLDILKTIKDVPSGSLSSDDLVRFYFSAATTDDHEKKLDFLAANSFDLFLKNSSNQTVIDLLQERIRQGKYPKNRHGSLIQIEDKKMLGKLNKMLDEKLHPVISRKTSKKNVYIGSAIACALVLLIIVGFAFSSGSGKNDNDTVSSTESVENTQK